MNEFPQIGKSLFFGRVRPKIEGNALPALRHIKSEDQVREQQHGLFSWNFRDGRIVEGYPQAA
ncbi:hypothetical protein ACFFNY_20315 [Paenibacillus hodogayensis]|uniref:Uncharacterized protein n=1 Tax=Paenibacillus hodogayensis TaxID=279208 RepID=A0ABV5W104_9BACL